MGKFIKENNNAYSQRICHFNDGAMRLNHRQTSYSTLSPTLAQYKSVRSLFGDKVLTSEDFLKCVSFDPLHEDLATSMLQLSCQNHFETFI